MRADRLLWMSELIVVFGRAVALKAHAEMARGKIDRAQALVNEYMPQLKEIHDQLVERDPDGTEGLVRLSPMPSCRYLLAEMLWKEAQKEAEEKKPDKAKIADLLFGAKEGGKRNGAGAFNHAINVFVKYPESSWAASAGELAEEIKKFVKTHFNKEVKTNITSAQIDNVRKMCFRSIPKRRTRCGRCRSWRSATSSCGAPSATRRRRRRCVATAMRLRATSPSASRASTRSGRAPPAMTYCGSRAAR